MRKKRPVTLQEYRRLQRLASAACVRAEALRKELAKTCKHPPEVVEDFRWEHDNGYDRQSMIVGDHCTLCYAQRSWKGEGMWLRSRQ